MIQEYAWLELNTQI